MSIFEWAVVAFICLTILFHVWRGGARNPESTGTLSGKLNGLSEKLGLVRERLVQVEARMEDLERDSASVKDIQRIETLIEGHRELSAATNRNVERIHQILIEKALNK